MSSLRTLHTSSLKGQAASAMWCVLSQSVQEAQNTRDYAGFCLPTSNLIAKPEVGT
jgi:hypothetical protein